MPRFQRPRGEEQRATTLELFFDLVFVFAVTQISRLLHAQLTWEGLGRATVALLVVWWAWNYTTWVTNELDPESTVVRLVLMALAFASLLMAVAIPDAFGARAGLFAGSYVAIQVGRHLFLAFGAEERGTPERMRALRVLAWFLASAPLWIAGAAAGGAARTGLWLAALLIEYSAPLALYWLPGRRRAAPDAWEVQTAHFAERFQLFVIIALGESIVVTGATAAGLHLGAARLAAFALAFVGTAAMWWLYFDYAVRIAERRLELSPDRTRMARDAYTYLHALIVAGVIAAAVGDQVAIAHPTAHGGVGEVAAVVAGPAVYLLAQALFRLRMAGSLSRKRAAGALACAAAGATGAFAPLLVPAALATAAIVAVIAAEQISGARRRGRGAASPLERLEASAAGR
ncbi:MAG TPA: low temperature requirement protein A [Solirubrobacteraceae bacterium]|nr:low temperature requirement protein A [Solirubrobacteraceae bacterium]